LVWPKLVGGRAYIANQKFRGIIKERVGNGSIPITLMGGIPGKIVMVELEYNSRRLK
jgi:hypothetical protein